MSEKNCKKCNKYTNTQKLTMGIGVYILISSIYGTIKLIELIF